MAALQPVSPTVVQVQLQTLQTKMSTERKSKQFWAEKGNNVALVTGYECPPNEGR